MSGDGFTFIVLDINEKFTGASAVLADEVEEPTQKEIDESNDDDTVSNFNIHGQTHCPHCGIHLGNGIGVDGDEVNGKPLYNKQFEFVCLACGGEFGEKIAHRALKPFQLAKQIVGEMVAKGNTSRKEIIAACVAAGIKYNTADGAHYEMCVRKS
jgi:hypothetical protein